MTTPNRAAARSAVHKVLANRAATRKIVISYSFSARTHRRVKVLARSLGIKRSPMIEAWVRLGLDACEPGALRAQARKGKR